MTSRRDSRVKRARAKATADITRRVKRSTALHLSLARIYKVLKLLFIYLYLFFFAFFFVLFVFPACNCVFVQYYQKRERERELHSNLSVLCIALQTYYARVVTFIYIPHIFFSLLLPLLLRCIFFSFFLKIFLLVRPPFYFLLYYYEFSSFSSHLSNVAISSTGRKREK